MGLTVEHGGRMKSLRRPCSSGETTVDAQVRDMPSERTLPPTSAEKVFTRVVMKGGRKIPVIADLCT